MWQFSALIYGRAVWSPTLETDLVYWLLSISQWLLILHIVPFPLWPSPGGITSKDRLIFVFLLHIHLIIARAAARLAGSNSLCHLNNARASPLYLLFPRRPACLPGACPCRGWMDDEEEHVYRGDRRWDTSERIEEYLRTILYSFDNNEQQSNNISISVKSTCESRRRYGPRTEEPECME